MLLSDGRETVFEKIRTHAPSGGQTTPQEHRDGGENPVVDVAYQFLYFFEESDERVERLARESRCGSLLSGELEELTAETIADFLEAHRECREELGSLEAEVPRYRLSETEKRAARRRVGYPADSIAQR